MASNLELKKRKMIYPTDGHIVKASGDFRASTARMTFNDGYEYPYVVDIQKGAVGIVVGPAIGKPDIRRVDFEIRENETVAVEVFPHQIEWVS